MRPRTTSAIGEVIVEPDKELYIPDQNEQKYKIASKLDSSQFAELALETINKYTTYDKRQFQAVAKKIGVYDDIWPRFDPYRLRLPAK